MSRAPPAPDTEATTTFRASRWFLGQCRSSCDVPQPSSPRCAPCWRCSSRPPRRRPRRSRSPSRPPATSRTPPPASRPSRTSPRSACTRCAWCSTGTTSRRRPTRASSRSSPRPIPASYDWSAYDAVVDGIKARGWNLLLTVSGPVPVWATNGARDSLTRPSPAEFQKFVHAVGLHYGTKVDTWSIWNEPNQPQFLMPQYSVHHTALSPGIYRKLFLAAQRGLARCRPRQRPCAAGGDLAAWHGQGRGAADLPARGAVPGLEVPQDEQELREAAALRLRPSRLHDGPGPDLQAHAAQRRHHRRALAADHRPRPRRQGRRDHRAPADLPDRVRHREHARPGARGEPAAPVGVPRDLRAHRLRHPARGRLLAVPAARRPAQDGRARRSSATPASRPACSPRPASPSPPTTASACRSRCAGSARRRSRCGASCGRPPA